jgi:hypothetical protein
LIKYLALATACIALTACETTSSRPYTVSTENIMAFQSSLNESGTKVKVADFTFADGVDESLSCRALGALEVAPGKSTGEFIEGAMRDELFAAGVYDQSNGGVINGEIATLKFNSFGTGSWDIGLKVSSEADPEGYTVDTHYTFKTSYSAIKACQNVIDAFTPAVQQLIGDVVEHPKFKSVAGATKQSAP